MADLPLIDAAAVLCGRAGARRRHLIFSPVISTPAAGVYGRCAACLLVAVFQVAGQVVPGDRPLCEDVNDWLMGLKEEGQGFQVQNKQHLFHQFWAVPEFFLSFTGRHLSVTVLEGRVMPI